MPTNYTNESSEMGGIDSSILYPILMKDYKWGNLNEDIYLDETNIRMTMNFRNNFSRLAQKLIKEKEYIKAKKVLDYCMTIMPGEKVALNYFVHPIIKSYYNINETESANKIIDLLHTTYSSELQYYLTFPENKIIGVSMEILKNLQFYNELVEIASKNNHPKALDMKQEFEEFYRSYLIL